MEKIHICFGSDVSFYELTSEIEYFNTIGDVLDYTNKTKIEIEGTNPKKEPPMKIKNLIIQTDDYGGIKEWAMLGFSNNILEQSEVSVENLWINNPPTKIYEDIKKTYPKLIEEHRESYEKICLDVLKNMADKYYDKIIGQDEVVKQCLISLYSLISPNRKKPITFLFIGESGVGKTETAKFINSIFNGEMVRVQCSMQQTNEAYKYIFGAEHGEDSLARELIRRESNLVLFDEFDKVNSCFYNAFYQMFDEGIFVDSNYKVNMEKSIIICTSNYLTEEDAEKHLGTPIYSRFTKVIKFKPISTENKIKIAEKSYLTSWNELSEDDKKLIEGNGVLKFYINSIRKGYYKNIRMLKNDIEDALNFEILKARKIL